MSTPRLSLYERLPEIYRIRDAEQAPLGELQAYLNVLDEVLGALRDNVEQLYHDRFIETCADWVIPYVADLLGTSHLTGDAWTLRADVARTVFHRRRKGTLGAIESLSYSLSGWAAHAVEMRERLMWLQHLNHQRPDAGGVPPLRLAASISEAVRGGTMTLRDPALLSQLNSPFDPFAHVVDVKPPSEGSGGYNLPNLAIFLWRLADYTVPVSKPVSPPAPHDIIALTASTTDEAAFSVRFNLHPLAEPMVLFNSYRFHADDDPPKLSLLDAVPGPMPAARLTEETPAGRPEEYVRLSPYADAPSAVPGADALGLTLHIPEMVFIKASPPFTTKPRRWRVRGANLCAWEQGLNPPLGAYEIVVDPEHGRVVFGVTDLTEEAKPLRDELLVSATYGFSGPTGAHPIARPTAPAVWLEETVQLAVVAYHDRSPSDPVDHYYHGPIALQDALALHALAGPPVIIEIRDSMTHDLDLAALDGIAHALRLRRSLWIRAASGERPVIRLARPLAFRPDDVMTPLQDTLTVKLEGLYISRGPDFGGPAALIERAALHQLVVEGCTLDPGGYAAMNGTRAPIRNALRLANGYGFTDEEATPFEQTPEIVIQRSICGPLLIGSAYSLVLTDSIVDAGVRETGPRYALRGASEGPDADPDKGWGPPTTISGVTSFGRMRVESVTGQGGIWTERLEAHDNQKGCLRFCYFSGDQDRLPPHQGCLFGPQPQLAFTSAYFGASAYTQLRLTSDRRILENGPGYDQMGAFGYLQNTHKWKNLHIRYREFMPVGVRPVTILIT